MNSNNPSWPRVPYDNDDQPHFLFIITPPYSGSTALSELLNSGYRTMILQEIGEGQWLVPGLCEKDRWNPDKPVDYESVKSIWLAVYQRVKRLTQNIDVVIEKSPPNMMRIEALAAQFRDCSFLANNRDPYGHCASMLYRLHKADELSEQQRKQVLESNAVDWLLRSEKIQELVSLLGIPLLTYEQFCRAPETLLEKLQLPDGVIDSIDPQSSVQVKDYATQGIVDQNARQIAKLTAAEIAHMNTVLARNTPVLEFFGYEIR